MKVYLNFILLIVTFGKVEPYAPIPNNTSFDDNILADPGEAISSEPLEDMERIIESTQIPEVAKDLHGMPIDLLESSGFATWFADENYANSKLFKIFIAKAWKIIQLNLWSVRGNEDKRWFNRDIAAYPAEILDTNLGHFQCTLITGEPKQEDNLTDINCFAKWLSEKNNPISKSLRLVLTEAWKVNQFVAQFPDISGFKYIHDYDYENEDSERKAAKELNDSIQEEYLPDIIEFAKWFAGQYTIESEWFTKLLARAWVVIRDVREHGKTRGSFYTVEREAQDFSADEDDLDQFSHGAKWMAREDNIDAKTFRRLLAKAVKIMKDAPWKQSDGSCVRI